jgi:hypothetical protein
MRNIIRCFSGPDSRERGNRLAVRFRSEPRQWNRWSSLGCVTLANADPLPGDLADLGGGSNGTGQQEVEPNTSPRQETRPTTDQHREALADQLGIEPELQEQIWGKKPATAGPSGGGEEGQGTEEGQPRKEAGNEDDDEVASGGQQVATATPSDGGQGKKRPGKLERKLEQLERELQQLREKANGAPVSSAETRHGEQAVDAATPEASLNLATVKNETELNQVEQRAQALLDWCDEHEDGTEVGEGENLKFLEPKTIAKWRKTAEKTLISAPSRRLQLRDSQLKQQVGDVQRQQFDALAKQAAPQAFEEGTPVAKKMAEVTGYLPMLKAAPTGTMLATALSIGLVEMEKTGAFFVDDKGNVCVKQANGQNGANHNGHDNPDVPAALTPEAVRLRGQIPIAPSTRSRPDSSSDPAATSSNRQFNDAMQQLAADPDGGVGSVAQAMRALNNKNRNGSGDGRRIPVPAAS